MSEPNGIGDGSPRTDDDGPPPDDGSLIERFGLTPARIAALVAALSFFFGALGFAIGQNLPRPPGADSVEVGFLRDMISHHEQAVTMARLGDAYGSEPDVQVFAREILLFQSYEIGLMERQLAHWGYSRADRPQTAMKWMDAPVPVGDMPGLASADEVDRLRDVKERKADALFVALMKDHHRGGVHMARYAAERTSDPFVRELAERMARNQQIEIGELEAARKRAGLSATPAGYNQAKIPDNDTHLGD